MTMLPPKGKAEKVKKKVMKSRGIDVQTPKKKKNDQSLRLEQPYLQH